MFPRKFLVWFALALCTWFPAAHAWESCERHVEILPNVTILATGGTIASKASSSTQTTDYRVGVGIEALLSAVPEICNISNVSGMQVSNVDSASINTTILLDLTSRLTAELTSSTVHGVVVTHGTDTLEETAFFLDLVLDSEKPVVITGAMRPSTALSADGPLNLYQAVKLAASSVAYGRGVMVALNDRIGSAYTSTKNNANSLDTFHATEQGQLGFFINQVPKFYDTSSKPRNKTYFDVSRQKTLPPVDILYGHQDSNSHLIRASIESGAKGIIFAGVGAGGWSLDGLKYAQTMYNRTGVPMIFSRRTNDGFAGGDSIYSFQMTSGFLSPQKARIMLQLALSAGYKNDEIRELFDSQ
ncbi:L-asparaginase [Penicillium samsonianum]|uniref:L-asparaginase n=1 Tax=Penicillium samsonianum TaxID=1882272 RepID=UPI002548F252|nr:L-asparaginase [Penicillium samsonianum]KAJ6150419.1 L-asparaginase [Penicillium samsonianum]